MRLGAYLADCFMYVLLAWLQLPAVVSIPFGVGVTFGLRMLAMTFNVFLPL